MGLLSIFQTLFVRSFLHFSFRGRILWRGFLINCFVWDRQTCSCAVPIFAQVVFTSKHFLTQNIFSLSPLRIILANLEISHRSILADGGCEYIGAKSHPVPTLEDYRTFQESHGANPLLWIGNFGLLALSVYLNTSFWIINASEGGMHLVDMVPDQVDTSDWRPVQAPDGLPEVSDRRSAHLWMSHNHYQVLLTEEMLPEVPSELLPSADFTCGQCKKILPTGNKLVRHMLQRHNITEPAVGLGRFRCDQCGFRAERRNRLVEHLRIHSKGCAPVSCGKCTYASPHPEDLRDHVRIKHVADSSVVEGGFICDLCGYFSKSMIPMRKHHKSVHPGGLPYSCDLCPVTASCVATLRKHKSHRHGDQLGRAGPSS